jgi:hypothetical protein
MKRSLQISEDEKKHILNKYNLLKEALDPRVKSITCGSGNTEKGQGLDCVIEYTNGDSFEGMTQNGLPQNGKYIFADGHFYYGSFEFTESHSKLHYQGWGMDGDAYRKVDTEDLIDYHKKFIGSSDDEEEVKPEDKPEDKPEEIVKPNEVTISDELRKKWEGCVKTQDPAFHFDGGRTGSKDLGTLTKMPEMGFAKFKGTVDGKTIEFRGCFDKFKMVRGFETGDRGSFDGYYYTEDETASFFLGDETKGNKFMWGQLSKSKDYKFHDADWVYTGSFVDGKINGTSKDIPPVTADIHFGDIKFSDGKKYEGDFEGEQINGKGIFLFPNGMKLEGDFKTNAEEGVTISVTTNENQFIPDIFKYNETYKHVTKKEEKKTVGAIKTSNFNGITKFKFNLESKKTGKKKDFQGPLPYVFVRITNTKDRKIFFETKSDSSGNFKIPNVPYGTYKLFFAVDGNIREFIYKKSKYVINKEEQKVSVPLKPSKYLYKSLRFDVINFDRSETRSDGSTFLPGTGAETYDLLGMTNEEMIEYVFSSIHQTDDKDWLSDLIAGRFEKKYGEVTSKEACLREFKNYADIIRKIQKKEIDLEILKKPGNDLQPTKEYLKKCVQVYGKQINDKDDVKLVANPPGEAYGYGVRLENKNKQNIYKDMGLSRTINKVVTEHANNKKSLIQESRIINNRLKMIAESYNLNRKSEKRLAFNELRNEKIKLISLGYDRNIVKESFIDVMKGLFGSTGQDPIADFKKGLSEKLSTPIDLKVIANELDVAIIEEAFKTENPKDLILETIIEKIKEKIDPQIDVVFQNINKKMDDFRNAVGGLQV